MSNRDKRTKRRDDRDYDTTQLHENSVHFATLHRDYTAHFFRWAFARRFITAEDHVLEIGCGQDRRLARLLTADVGPHVKSYVGVDINRLKPTEHQRLTFLGEFNFVERYRELKKLRPEGFDVVVHLEVIEHMKVEHGRKLLRACHELLRPGGVMLMSTPCYDGKRHAANHIHEYTVPELQAAVEKAKFKVRHRFGTFMDIKHIGKAEPVNVELKAIKQVRKALLDYYDNNALSCFFAPLYPDHARNNLWVCDK